MKVKEVKLPEALKGIAWNRNDGSQKYVYDATKPKGAQCLWSVIWWTWDQDKRRYVRVAPEAWYYGSAPSWFLYWELKDLQARPHLPFSKEAGVLLLEFREDEERVDRIASANNLLQQARTAYPEVICPWTLTEDAEKPARVYWRQNWTPVNFDMGIVFGKEISIRSRHDTRI